MDYITMDSYTLTQMFSFDEINNINNTYKKISYCEIIFGRIKTYFGLGVKIKLG